jgi:hypothetical protein
VVEMGDRGREKERIVRHDDDMAFKIGIGN